MASRQATAVKQEAVSVSSRFKITRRLVYPLLKLEEGITSYLRFDTGFYIGKDIQGSDKQPPVLALATDLETGEQGEVIIGSVLKGIFEEKCPDFIGKTFAVTLLHISIAIATISIIQRGARWPWYTSIALGAGGVLIATYAYFV